MNAIEPIVDDTFGAFAAAHAGKALLLVFSSPTCGPCRAMIPAATDMGAMYRDRVAFGHVSIDQAPALADRFGVATVPTLVVLSGGEEVARSIGTLPKSRIAALLDGALDVRVPA